MKKIIEEGKGHSRRHGVVESWLIPLYWDDRIGYIREFGLPASIREVNDALAAQEPLDEERGGGHQVEPTEDEEEEYSEGS